MASKAKRSPRGKQGGDGTQNGDEPKIDVVLEQLEEVVEQLEGGELGLEQALERFEAGVKLARQGGALLDAMEERVEVLLAHRGETEAFEDQDEEDDD